MKQIPNAVHDHGLGSTITSTIARTKNTDGSYGPSYDVAA
jgi:hypothetical protein